MLPRIDAVFSSRASFFNHRKSLVLLQSNPYHCLQKFTICLRDPCFPRVPLRIRLAKLKLEGLKTKAHSHATSAWVKAATMKIGATIQTQPSVAFLATTSLHTLLLPKDCQRELLKNMESLTNSKRSILFCLFLRAPDHEIKNRQKIKAVINLEEPGEHPKCGDGIDPATGFAYDPEVLNKSITFFAMA